MQRNVRSAITTLLPTTVRDDYRRTRKLVQVQQAFGSPCPIPGCTFLRRLRLTAFPKRTLLLYPTYPIDNYVIYKLCAVLGYKLVDQPGRRHDLAIHYFPTTYADAGTMRRLPAGRPVINGRLSDTSKTHVAVAFERHFGYPLRIDPTRHLGKAVVKSEENGVRDAAIVECPIPPESLRAGYSYQKAVDNRTPNGGYLDYRVAVHGRRLPLVYRKYHAPNRQFVRDYSHVELCGPEDVFNSDEIEAIVDFAERFDLDFGELDVLRDEADGRIYVVDVNNVPVGPRVGPQFGFTRPQAVRAVRILSVSFGRMVEDFIARRGAKPDGLRPGPPAAAPVKSGHPGRSAV